MSDKATNDIETSEALGWRRFAAGPRSDSPRGVYVAVWHRTFGMSLKGVGPNKKLAHADAARKGIAKSLEMEAVKTGLTRFLATGEQS